MFPFAAAILLLAQLPAPPIRVTTQMVEVDVVVRDKSGPVAGLKQEDFVLRDRGRIQKIAVFRESSSRVDRALEVPLTPGDFANVRGDADRAQRAIVIVWDHLNSDFGDAEIARKQALKALEQIRSNDRVCLYVLDSELHVMQDFTSDSSMLVEALRQYREERLARPFDVPLLVAGGGDPRVAEMYAAINAELTAKSAAYRAERTAVAVRTIVQHLGSVPGRKSVIWIASEIPPAAAALASDGIAVYPVDLSGTSAISPQTTYFERSIAQKSGGIAFVHSNLRGAIDQAVKDSEVGYTLGFYPDRTPDPVNALKVEVSKKGLDVGYRSAYSGIAKPDSAHGTAVNEALASPLDATQISLRVHLARQGGGWSLALQLDPADIGLENQNGKCKGGLDIALRQFTVDGLALSTTITKAELEFDEPRYRGFMSNKHPLTLAIPDPPSRLMSIRLVVADRVSGRIGSLTIPIPR